MIMVKRAFQRVADRLGNFLMTYFHIIITLVLGLILIAAVLAPILSYFGLDVLAKPLFFEMHLLCAQTPSHSFYLFGHQLCLCERCLAIYSSMFLASLLFVFSKKRLRGIHWSIWLLMTLPMAADGLTQMFGLRESTWELRLITGALFGFAAMWFTLPFMQKTIEQDTQRALAYNSRSANSTRTIGTP